MQRIRVLQRGLFTQVFIYALSAILISVVAAFLLQWSSLSRAEIPWTIQVVFALQHRMGESQLTGMLRILGILSAGLLVIGAFFMGRGAIFLGRCFVLCGGGLLTLLLAAFSTTLMQIHTWDLLACLSPSIASGYPMSQKHLNNLQIFQQWIFLLQRSALLGCSYGVMIGSALGCLIYFVQSKLVNFLIVFIFLGAIGVGWQVLSHQFPFMIALVGLLIHHAILPYLIVFTVSFFWFLGRRLKQHRDDFWKTLGSQLTVLSGSVIVAVCTFMVLACLPIQLLHGFANDPQHTHYLKVHLISPACMGSVAGLGFAWLCWWGCSRYVSAFWINTVQPKLTRKARSKEHLTDVRTAHNEIPKVSLNYDPKQYFQAGKMFFGLSNERTPVYLSHQLWCERSMHIMGQPGSGKTASACVLLAQSVMHGDAVFVLEGKDDVWARHVLKQAAARAGRRFIFIKLEEDTPQFNLFQHIQKSQLRELFNAEFAQGDTGQMSDHYKKKDRRITRQVADRYQFGESLIELFDREVAPNEAIQKDGEGFYLSLEEMAALRCIQTRGGVDFREAILRGDVVYVLGNFRDEGILKLQKMLLIRWMQLIETRDLSVDVRQVTIFLDEFRFMISNAAMQALATLRDKRGNLILAHQAKGDLRVQSADVSADSVESSTKTNSPIGMYYHTNDVDSQQWISDMTQKIVIKKTRERVLRNPALSEQIQAEKTIEDVQRNLITPEMISVLPKHFSVIVGVEETAAIIATAPYKTEKTKIQIEPAQPVPVTQSPVVTHNQNSLATNQSSKNKPKIKTVPITQPSPMAQANIQKQAVQASGGSSKNTTKKANLTPHSATQHGGSGHAISVNFTKNFLKKLNQKTTHP